MSADRVIIEHLQQDGRIPFPAIAAETDPLQLGYPRQAMLGVITRDQG